MLDNKEILILTDRECKKKHHVSYDTVLGMEDAFVKEGASLINFSPQIAFFNKVLFKLGGKCNLLDPTVPHSSNKNYLFIAMRIEDIVQHKSQLKKIGRNNHLGIYCFDVWESQYRKWNDIFEFVQPYVVFFAYKKSFEYFNDFFKSYFIPQSMDERFFYPRNLKKNRLFIQIGRRNEKIHNMILYFLKKKKLSDSESNYIYEKKKGSILFADTNELASNISCTKYFVAAPQSLENEKLTGKVSDVTARFYEAMACKTLIIGYKPETFDELFSSDAMIELTDDKDDFVKKITFLENNPEYYKKIVENNFIEVMKNHTWGNRYIQIVNAYYNFRGKEES